MVREIYHDYENNVFKFECLGTDTLPVNDADGIGWLGRFHIGQGSMADVYDFSGTSVTYKWKMFDEANNTWREVQ